MTHHLCIPSDVFETILQAHPGAVVEADATKKYAVIDGIEFSAPLAELGVTA